MTSVTGNSRKVHRILSSVILTPEWLAELETVPHLGCREETACAMALGPERGVLSTTQHPAHALPSQQEGSLPPAKEGLLLPQPHTSQRKPGNSANEKHRPQERSAPAPPMDFSPKLPCGPLPFLYKVTFSFVFWT